MAKKKELNTYILVDRSQSMGPKWKETLGSINTYVKELGIGLVTVATFDYQAGLQFDIIRDSVAAKSFKPITDADAVPRGWTPLYDALTRVISLAEKANKEKTVLVVMTDGEENKSVESNKVTAKAALDRFKDKKWQVVFLGADFDAFGQSASVGVGLANTLTMTTGNYEKTMRSVSAMTMNYCSTGASMDFNDEIRAKASGKT